MSLLSLYLRMPGGKRTGHPLQVPNVARGGPTSATVWAFGADAIASLPDGTNWPVPASLPALIWGTSSTGLNLDTTAYVTFLLPSNGQLYAIPQDAWPALFAAQDVCRVAWVDAHYDLHPGPRVRRPLFPTLISNEPGTASGIYDGTDGSLVGSWVAPLNCAGLVLAGDATWATGQVGGVYGAYPYTVSYPYTSATLGVSGVASVAVPGHGPTTGIAVHNIGIGEVVWLLSKGDGINPGAITTIGFGGSILGTYVAGDAMFPEIPDGGLDLAEGPGSTIWVTYDASYPFNAADVAAGGPNFPANDIAIYQDFGSIVFITAIKCATGHARRLGLVGTEMWVWDDSNTVTRYDQFLAVLGTFTLLGGTGGGGICLLRNGEVWIGGIDGLGAPRVWRYSPAAAFLGVYTGVNAPILDAMLSFAT